MQSGDNIPFPSTGDTSEDRVMDERASLNPSPEPLVLISPSSVESGSNATTSSKSTSSDKLSALPPLNIPTPTSTGRRPRSASLNMKRGYHHSLSASSSPIRSTENDGVGHKIPSANFHLGDPRHATSLENGSSGKVTPQQRVSFESDRHSLPTVRQAISQMLRGGEPLTSSPPMRSSPFPEPREGEQSSNSNNQQHFNSPSPSQSRSRATSPLRMLRDLSTRLHLGRTAPEERFVPVDPFRSKIRLPFCGLRSHKQHDLENGGDLDSSGAYDCEDLLPVNAIKSWGKDTRIFFLDTLPRELYLNFLLRLPAMYFSRVARIFEDADVSRPDIQRMINNAGGAGGAMPTAPHAVDQNASPLLQDSIRGRLQPGMVPAAGASAAAGAISMMHMPLPFPDEWSPPLVSPALVRFKHSWEDFIDSLLREWKTLNVVSALLASAILTIFQIPEAADDPITRTFAVLSLICALMSLSYGCIYIVRFGTMRSMFHASRWAEDARETKTSIWWNVWVLLATPAIWMAWSMLLFISAILSFVWRTGSVLDPPDRDPLSARTALGPRILITGVFMLGLVYLGMIIRTLRKYGSYQTSSRALPAMGAGRGTTNEFGKDINNPEVTSVKRPRARDIDAAMERRGRERKRSVSSHVRRREEAAGRGGSVDSGFEDLKLPNLASRSLGVGSRATTPYGELGMDIEMDSKVPGDVSVKKVPIFTR